MLNYGYAPAGFLQDERNMGENSQRSPMLSEFPRSRAVVIK